MNYVKYNVINCILNFIFLNNKFYIYIIYFITKNIGRFPGYVEHRKKREVAAILVYSIMHNTYTLYSQGYTYPYTSKTNPGRNKIRSVLKVCFF